MCVCVCVHIFVFLCFVAHSLESPMFFARCIFLDLEQHSGSNVVLDSKNVTNVSKCNFVARVICELGLLQHIVI
jgi:hypothetical protein